MSRQYSHKTFFRQVPNAILKQYFERKGLLGHVEFEKLGETQIEPIMEAFQALPVETQTEIEGQFRDIHDLACEAGVRALLEEARFHRLDLARQFAQMSNHYERAFWTFLHHPDVFRVAGDLAYMDRVGAWRRRNLGVYFSPSTAPEDLQKLNAAVRDFYAIQGRGRRCRVDNYLRRDPERHCYFVYPEDYATTDMVFAHQDQEELELQYRKSPFEVIFVYRPDDGVLEVRAAGGRPVVEALQEIFCRTILKLEGLPGEPNRPAFNLSVLKDPDFPFPTDPQDGIEQVRVNRLRVDLPGRRSRRLILEADTSGNSRATYDLLKGAIKSENVPLKDVTISQAKLLLVFAPRGGKRRKTLTFEISIPDRCTLKDDPLHQIAKKYLKEWGIARE